MIDKEILNSQFVLQIYHGSLICIERFQLITTKIRFSPCFKEPPCTLPGGCTVVPACRQAGERLSPSVITGGAVYSISVSLFFLFPPFIRRYGKIFAIYPS
jgi:hypothetical protein